MSEMNANAKICPRCGRKFSVEAQFCPDCGVLLSENAEEKKPTPVEAKTQAVPIGEESGIFANCGAKIRKFVKIGFILGIIFSVVFAIVLFSLAGQSWNKGPLILAGIIVLTLLPLAIWELSLYFYGYGEMIDKITAIEKMLRNKGDGEE